MKTNRAATVTPRPPPAAPARTSAAGQLERDFTVIDSLAHYVARHLEDGASTDPIVRRRYGCLVGLLAERVESTSSSL